MEIYLGLGSNLGDREAFLRLAVEGLSRRDVTVRRSASLYATEPRGFEEQPWFLNTVLEVRTLKEPAELLTDCLAIEQEAGRVRERKDGPRSLDIDILIYKDRLIDSPALVIPHPRYRDRRFVLTPLAELAPDLPDPASGMTMRQLLDLCSDEGEVRRWADPLL